MPNLCLDLMNLSLFMLINVMFIKQSVSQLVNSMFDDYKWIRKCNIFFELRVKSKDTVLRLRYIELTKGFFIFIY